MKKEKGSHSKKHSKKGLLIIIVLVFVLFIFFAVGSDDSEDGDTSAGAEVVDTANKSWEDLYDEASYEDERDTDYAVVDAGPNTKGAAANAAWTILVYMSGSNLESDGGAASANLREMMEADFGDRVNVVVLTGGSPSWELEGIDPGTLGYYHVADGTLVRDQSAPAASMGDPNNLGTFISWGAAAYPAQKYGLIMWDHGGGSLAGLCWDDNFGGDNLTLPEYSAALSQGGVHFEMIGMDTCLMASLETGAAIDDFGKYMVASQEFEPGGGWNYRTFLNYLGLKPDTTGDELGKVICKSFYDKCSSNWTEDQATLSVIDLSKIAPLNEAFRTMSAQMAQQTQSPDSFRALCEGAYSTENYGGNNRSEGYTDMIDLKGLAQNTASLLSGAADPVLSLVDQAVIYEVHGDDRQGAEGISVVYPLMVDPDVQNSYSQISDNEPYKQFMAIVGDTWEPLDWEVDGEETDDSMRGMTLNPIQSKDYNVEISQEIDDESILHLTVTDGLDSIEHADFSLFYQEPESGDYVFLGTDSDLDVDWDKGIFSDNFQGTWITIGDQYVNAYLVSMEDDYNIYTIPAIVNGEETNIRATYTYDTEEFKIIGTYDGVDEETGAAGRNVNPLKKGDKVQFVFTAFDENLDETDPYETDTITWSDDIVMEDQELMDGDYIYMMSVYDFFGNEYDGDPILINYEDGTITEDELE
ncbi:MAG: clostripain-related cysteine peptidase [Lachnospiraceae bacterium]|nr:clostripain-related cysteine peptidase [Lachnospiraceae bacterium]